MADAEKRPQRAVVIDLKIGADSDIDVLAALRNLETDFAINGVRESVSGGPSWHHSVTVRRDPDMTHDRYFEEITLYLKTKEGEDNG